MDSNKNPSIEEILATLAPKAFDLKYFKFSPSPELLFFVAYIKFGASKDDFADLIRNMKMVPYFSGRNTSGLLPAAWKALHDLNIEWWDPTDNNPADSAAKPFGQNGWIIAKHEREHVYMIITDTDIEGNAT